MQQNVQTVSYFGIHWDQDAIAHLMQGRGGTNAVGAKLKSPFEVRLPGRMRHCNHQVPLASPVPNDYHWNFFLQLYGDPLVQAMLPIPKQDSGIYYIVADSPRLLQALVLLSKLSSPIYSVVQPMWNIKPPFLMNELEMTNIQPFVVTDCAAKDSSLIRQVAEAGAYKPRTIIFSGAADVILPPSVKRITTRLTSDDFSQSDLITLPWESIGATIIRKYMRGEWPPKLNPVQGSYELAAKTPPKALPNR